MATKDVTVKSVPDTITDEELCRWVEILVKRQENKIGSGTVVDKMKPVTQKSIDDGKKIINDFKKANKIEDGVISEQIEKL